MYLYLYLSSSSTAYGKVSYNYSTWPKLAPNWEHFCSQTRRSSQVVKTSAIYNKTKAKLNWLLICLDCLAVFGFSFIAWKWLKIHMTLAIYLYLSLSLFFFIQFFSWLKLKNASPPFGILSGLLPSSTAKDMPAALKAWLCLCSLFPLHPRPALPCPALPCSARQMSDNCLCVCVCLPHVAATTLLHA